MGLEWKESGRTGGIRRLIGGFVILAFEIHRGFGKGLGRIRIDVLNPTSKGYRLLLRCHTLKPFQAASSFSDIAFSIQHPRSSFTTLSSSRRMKTLAGLELHHFLTLTNDDELLIPVTFQKRGIIQNTSLPGLSTQ